MALTHEISDRPPFRRLTHRVGERRAVDRGDAQWEDRLCSHHQPQSGDPDPHGHQHGPPADSGGDEPFAMVVTPNGRTVYVGNASSVTPIRVSTNSPLADIPVGNQPARMVITPDGRTVYTVNAADNTVTPIRVSATSTMPP